MLQELTSTILCISDECTRIPQVIGLGQLITMPGSRGRERESLNLVGPRSGPAWSAWPLLLISNGGEDLFLGDDVI